MLDSTSGMDNPGCMDNLGNERLERSTVEKDLGVLVDGKLNVNQQCPGTQEGQPCSGVHQAEHQQAGKGGDCPTVLCTGAASPGVLGAVWGITTSNGYEVIRERLPLHKRGDARYH